jgi:DNA-binding MarR family transcriptional regulator
VVQPTTPLNIGLLLFIPYRTLEQRVFERLAQEGFGDITVAQGRVFARIGAQGSRIVDLAEQAQVTKQTAGFLVEQLEKAGYVVRTAHPTDRRAQLVRVGPRGEAAVKVGAAAIEEVESEWTAHLGARDVQHLRRILTQLREITDPYA